MRVYSLRSDSIIAWINSSVCYIVYCSFTLIYIKKDKLINFRINGKLTISHLYISNISMLGQQ